MDFIVLFIEFFSNINIQCSLCLQYAHHQFAKNASYIMWFNCYLSWMCILFSRPSGTRSGCLICWPYGPCLAVKKHIKQKIYSSPWNQGLCYIFILWYSYYKQSLFNALIYYCFRIYSMTEKKRQSMQRGMLVCFTYLFLSSKWTFISVCHLSLSLTQLLLIRQCWTIMFHFVTFVL